ncbi:MAG TPA: ATP synthase subunit I, partial [Gammaproteobacteria bacterium]|nr:ATP synthase subunit I [Gammaproteobacteria bacterium]
MFGILASVLPNLVFRWLYYLPKAKEPHKFIRLFYLNEGLKFASLALLVSAFLLWPKLQVSKFFAAFVLSELLRVFYQAYALTRTSK